MKPYIYRLLNNDEVQDFHEGCFYLTDQRMAHLQAELYNEKTSDSEIILNAMGVYTRYSDCQMYSFLCYSLC